MRLRDDRMADGSRNFGALPERYDPAVPEWHRLREHVARLEGAVLTGFVTDDVTEAWIDFRFAGHEFSLNNPAVAREWWFFVGDPRCPPELLERVLAHFETLLDPTASLARGLGAVGAGHHRVLVVEPDGRARHRDFATLDEAQAYAVDVRHEVEDDRGAPLAYVFDDQLRRVT
jgi:hypothetical protein